MKTAPTKNNFRPYIMPGDRTPFADIKCLVPNHEVKLSGMVARRFYPRRPLLDMDLETACDLIASMLKKEGNVLAENYKIIESLTAGNDSRITLAAMHDRKSEITCFTYHDVVLDEKNYNSVDRWTNYYFAKNLCNRENIDHYEMLTTLDALPNEVLPILKQNHYHQHIPGLLVPYSKVFTDGSIHLRSNLIEIIRGNLHAPLVKMENEQKAGEHFAELNSYYKTNKYFSEAAEIFQQFYYELEYNKMFDYPVDIFYFWEYRLGLWISAAVLTESDLVCDTFQLFNNRKLLDIGLAMPSVYRNRSAIYEKLLKRLWPELLNYNLPNCKISNYDLLNKNYTDNDNFLYFSDKIKKLSGNLYDSSRNVKECFEPYMQGCLIGFAGNKLKKGDYVSIKYERSVEKDVNYYWQCQIKTTEVKNSAGLIYAIIYNGKEVYRLSTKATYFTNTIRLMYKAKESGKSEIEVRLFSEKDIEDSIHNGILDISNIEVSRDYSGKERGYVPQVVDFYNTIKNSRF